VIWFICSFAPYVSNLGIGMGAELPFDHAVEIFNDKMPQFLIPGVGTYLFDSVRLQINLVAGWVLLGIVESEGPSQDNGAGAGDAEELQAFSVVYLLCGN
jgi:hypothetical protein